VLHGEALLHPAGNQDAALALCKRVTSRHTLLIRWTSIRRLLRLVGGTLRFSSVQNSCSLNGSRTGACGIRL
jgi:hypothetical protein